MQAVPDWTVPRCLTVPLNCRLANGGWISKMGQTSIMKNDGGEEGKFAATGVTTGMFPDPGGSFCFMETFMANF